MVNNIEQALKQVREETIEKCADIAKHKDDSNCENGDYGLGYGSACNAIEDEIRELKGKA